MGLPASKQAAAGGGLAKTNVGQSEHELRAMNERLEHALDAAHIGVWDWYPQTNVLIASHAAQDLLGYEPGEFPGTMAAYRSRLHADDRERVEAAMSALLEGLDDGTSTASPRRGLRLDDGVEHRIVRPAGEVRWLLVKGQLTRDEEGKPLRVSGTVLDITARKREDWAQRLFAGASAAMASLDAATYVRQVARAIAHRFADWALLRVLDPDGAVLTEIAASHVTPEERGLVRELWAKPVAGSVDPLWARVARFPSDDGDDLRRLAQSPAHSALLELIRPASWMLLPLHVRGHAVGALTVARTHERNARFDERDLATFTELARRISVRLENAFLFRAEQRQLARFQALVEATAQIVWTSDAQGVPKADWLEWQGHTGEPAEELVRSGGLSAVHPDDREVVRVAWLQAIERGMLFEHELRARRPDGTYHSIVARATPVRDVEGRVVEWIGITVDVQEQREVRARLEASEARYRRIVETANEGIWTADLEAKTLFANPRMAEILETSVDELLTHSVYDFLFDDDIPGVRAVFAMRARGQQVTREEYRLRTVRGREVWVRRTAAPLVGPRGRVEGVIGFFTDITEAKHAERYRARYELLAKYARDVVMFIDPDTGRILEANDAAMRVYGYTRAKLLTLTIADLHAPETRADLPAQLSAAAGDGILFQTTHMRLDGSRFPVEASARGVRLDGQLFVLSVVRDITVRRRAEEARDESDRFRELFIGMLGHDLRTPLSAILMGSALLLRRGTLSEAEVQSVRRVHTSGQRMARMIDQLLDFTRTRLGGGIPAQCKTLDLRDLLEHVVEELSAANPEAVVTLEHEGATGGAWDEDRLAEVFSNLIHNALKHGDGEQVRVSLRGEDTEVFVRVHNGGEPIDPSVLPLIFDPFRRAERRAEGKKSGLGLGLYISQQIVMAHAGEIRVRSTKQEGTIFEVVLPRAREG
jgi:PAS domain S-box-containing protein